MHPRAYNKISHLSLEFRDPKWALLLMKDYLNANLSYQNATIVRNTIEKFCKLGIALKDAHDTAVNMTNKMKQSGAQFVAIRRIEKVIMEEKLVDARKSVKIAKVAMNVIKSKMSKVIRVGTLVRKLFMNIVKEECELNWDKENEKAKVKIQRNFVKQKNISDNNDSIIDVFIHNILVPTKKQLLNKR